MVRGGALFWGYFTDKAFLIYYEFVLLEKKMVIKLIAKGYAEIIP